jgi:hypothetical protein
MGRISRNNTLYVITGLVPVIPMHWSVALSFPTEEGASPRRGRESIVTEHGSGSPSRAFDSPGMTAERFPRRRALPIEMAGTSPAMTWRVLQSIPDRLAPSRTTTLRTYSPNLFDFGKPFGGRRPASVRSPIQSRRSSLATVQVRPEVSFQVRPSFSLKTLASETPPSL